MRILLTADPELPVPPKHYGGIERIVDMLARGLSARGHEITLLAHSGSSTAGNLVPWPGASSVSVGDTVRNSAMLARWVISNRVDIIHSFSRIAYLTPILPLSIPKLMSYQRAITSRTVRLGYTLSRGTLTFSAISEWMMQQVKHVGRWIIVPNGVCLDTYDFQPTVPDDAPLVFLGRIEEIKGPHLAVEIARRTGRKLIIAGNIPDEKRAWFASHVLPNIDDQSVKYVGPVDDQQKNALLGKAAALLMPILWEEPFGIVMAEAMACGTPVLGLARGAVPEVVEHGVTGLVERDVDGLVAAVSQIPTLSRFACRARVESLYSDGAVVDAYEALYQSLIDSRERTKNLKCASA